MKIKLEPNPINPELDKLTKQKQNLAKQIKVLQDKINTSLSSSNKYRNVRDASDNSPECIAYWTAQSEQDKIYEELRNIREV